MSLLSEEHWERELAEMRQNEEHPRAIISFTEPFRWLSNFYPSPVKWEGQEYATVEHAYQAAKTADPERQAFIRHTRTPGNAKRAGAQVALIPGWDVLKVEVMRELLRRKFAPGSTLARKLVATHGMQLIEGNTWGDTFWGVCRGKGENQLGKLLMEIRDDLIAKPDDTPEVKAAKAHMTAIPFGGRWPEVPTSPIEPGLKAFDVRFSVTIEATDRDAAIALAGNIAEFMMGAASAHDAKGVAAVQACSHSVGSPAPADGWDANGSPVA